MSDIDWTVLEIDGVMDVAEKVARRVATDWHPSFEVEDLTQEAYIILATNHEETREALELGGVGLLNKRLWRDLTNHASGLNRKLHLNTSLDAIIDRVVAE